MEEEECEFIILQDQTSLLESLLKNELFGDNFKVENIAELREQDFFNDSMEKLRELLLSLLRNEVPQVAVIDFDLDLCLQNYKEASNNLSIKLDSLKNLSKRLDEDEKQRIIEFVDKIEESSNETIKKTNDEYSNYSVISRSVYGLPLKSLLSEIRRETAAIQVSLRIGEVIYNSEFILQGYIYCNEIARLLNSLEGCDKRIQQYLVVSKATSYLRELDVMIDVFASKNNLLPPKNEELTVFSAVSSLLTGELLGWKPPFPDLILKQNTEKKPIFITKNTKRTQVKRLANLPLFHSTQKDNSIE